MTDNATIVRTSLLLGTLLGAGACVPVTAAGKSGVHVKKVALNPRSVSGAGGDLAVKIQVTGKTKSVERVRIQASLPGGNSGPLVDLAQGKGQTYAGECHVPANRQLVAAKANVTVYLTVSGTVQTVSLASVPVGPGSDALPPPPPAK